MLIQKIELFDIVCPEFQTDFVLLSSKRLMVMRSVSGGER